jgi:RimJ/RimL family protein N-acetyltransferase
MTGDASGLAEVTLRLLTGADADAIEKEHTPDLNAYNWFGVRRPGGLRRKIEAGEDLTDDGGSFAIGRRGGHLLGDISWRKIATGPGPASFCWEIGIYVLASERGRGVGGQAQRLLAAYLFDTTLAVRVQASADITNLAEQRALENAGFTREGVLRKVQYRFGAWHDDVIYSKLRGDE